MIWWLTINLFLWSRSGQSISCFAVGLPVPLFCLSRICYVSLSRKWSPNWFIISASYEWWVDPLSCKWLIALLISRQALTTQAKLNIRHQSSSINLRRSFFKGTYLGLWASILRYLDLPLKKGQNPLNRVNKSRAENNKSESHYKGDR